jgi:hypothetical protein
MEKWAFGQQNILYQGANREKRNRKMRKISPSFCLSDFSFSIT